MTAPRRMASVDARLLLARKLAAEADTLSDAAIAGEAFDCIDLRGHLFKTQCGETKCVYCDRIAWS